MSERSCPGRETDGNGLSDASNFLVVDEAGDSSDLIRVSPWHSDAGGLLHNDEPGRAKPLPLSFRSVASQLGDPCRCLSMRTAGIASWSAGTWPRSTRIPERGCLNARRTVRDPDPGEFQSVVLGLFGQPCFDVTAQWRKQIDL